MAAAPPRRQLHPFETKLTEGGGGRGMGADPIGNDLVQLTRSEEENLAGRE